MPLDFAAPPTASATGHAGTYRRSLPVALERLYENALDWEHLPWVHPGSFRGIESLGITANSWRARTESPRGGRSVIELTLDRASRRWITRVLEGEGAGNEIWTHAFPMDPRRVDIVVDFFLPSIPAAARAAAGEAYARLYARLYDEDVAMMVERTHQLERRLGEHDRATRVVALGLRGALRLPVRVTLAGQDFLVVESGGELCAFPAQCPHQLGPLSGAGVVDGVVTCPWHGDRFDLRSGRNLTGRNCHLRPLPAVRLMPDGQVVIALEP
jgi:nitrite reductase/ring-hydroxylating ferredoxin subunit